MKNGIVSYKVKNVIEPIADLSKIRLNGISRNITERFYEKRVFSDFAKNVIYKEAEDAFRTKRDGQKYVGLWQGEFWGKLVLSATEVYKSTGDDGLKKFLHRAALTLITLQREDGYLNTYENSMNVFEVDPKKAVEHGCAAFNWNWNVWCRKYTLWGLIAVYEITEDEKILSAARRMADQMIDEFQKNGLSLKKTGVLCGLPSCSILKPLMLLYKHTGNEKYYTYAKNEIIDNWQRPDGEMPNLITNALSKKPIAEWYPEPNKWAKAYEMMSCFEGILEFYRFDGDPKFLTAAERFYDILVEYELNPIFSVAYNDMFGNAADYINAISEPCDSIHFMRLCYELYLLTGEKKYTDSIELTYYNAFLAGVFRNGEFGSRAVRGVGRHMWGPQSQTKYQHCCVDNMPRAFVRFAEASVMTCKEAIIINTYEALTAEVEYEGGKCNIEVSDGYFVGKPVTINASFTGDIKPIRLRMPEWCEGFEVSCDAEAKAVDGYYEITSHGCELTAKIDMHIRPIIRDFNKPIQKFYDNSAWQFDRWISDYVAYCSVPKELFLNEKRCTIVYGPLLLAKSKRLGNDENDIFRREPISPDSTARLVPIDSGEVNYAYSLEVEKNGEIYKTTVCDFASAGNEILEDDKFFSMYF